MVRPLRAVLLLLGFVGPFAVGRPALAARFAILAGNNEGHGADAHLRFAESDTVRLARLLTHLGGFSDGTTTVLLARTAVELQSTLVEVADRLRTTAGEHLVLVYYSGHADAQSLHLGTSRFPLTQLRDMVDALPAATRVLILDACQAGVLTRPKGGRAGPGFEIDFAKDDATTGLAILAASSGSEMAQESDQLHASVFTHYLEVGLSGLADRNRDGNVSLGEVFDYTADHTLTATMGAAAGPQHPTFRFDLAGRDDLILTRPGLSGAGYARLRLDVPGWYFVRRANGTIAAETISGGDDTLALEPGLYEVTRRERNELDVAVLSLDDGGATAISRAASHPVAFGRMVRKGQGPDAAYALAISTTVRRSLEDLGLSAGAAIVARVDLQPASVELRLGLGRATHASEHLSSATWEWSAAVAGLRAVDLGPLPWRSSLTCAFGAEVGLARLAQTLDEGSRRSSLDPYGGPVALAELAVGRRFFIRTDVGLPVYALRVQTTPASNRTEWRPAWAAALGVGTSF